MKKIIVVKVGGSTFNSSDTTLHDLVKLQKTGWSLVVVHGGGDVVSRWLGKMNIVTPFVGGLRVTDKASL
ncbi:MAG: acetylglutamate kinase, partial [Dehalococcoidia bacterium]|nr:acetylglutamate kinase [Dehalococcoidia bacterium]